MQLLAGLARELAERERRGLLRSLALPAGRDFTSNDYLALARDPRLVAAAREALEAWGAGAPAARLLRGQLPPHAEAEAAAAAWQGTEAALLFPSGWQANQALLGSVLGRDDAVFSDALNHASLIDGIRLGRARRRIFPHSDLEALDAQLAAAKDCRRRLIVVEEVYSMDGDRAPLRELLRLAEEHDAWLYLDRAHAVGLFPAPAPHPRLLATMLTGGKALGVHGAFVCAARTTIDWLLNFGRSFVYTTAIPPASAAALIRAIAVVRAEPERGRRALARAAALRGLLADGGLETRGESAIVPVLLGSPERALRLAEAARAAGFDVRAVRPPTVPPGSSRLRIVCHADHTAEEVARLAGVLRAAAEELPGADRSAGSVPARRAEVNPAPTSGRAHPAEVSTPPLVVCGTDTDIGKTTVSAVLLRALRRIAEDVRYLKPLQTGEVSDTATVRALAQLPPQATPPPVRALPLPASVDQAAAHAGTTVSLAEVRDGVRARLAEAPAARWVLECAGGLRVPLNDTEDQADLLAALGLPLVLVARSGLGTLNHTLLSVEAARRRGLQLRALILSGPPHPANVATLRRWLPGLPLVELPPLLPLGPRTIDAWLETAGLEAWL